ncbi:MAG TPA: hypothetical protein PLN79_12085 [bacterium]|nr:hypothetical protein [bacterium]
MNNEIGKLVKLKADNRYSKESQDEIKENYGIRGVHWDVENK